MLVSCMNFLAPYNDKLLNMPTFLKIKNMIHLLICNFSLLKYSVSLYNNYENIQFTNPISNRLLKK